MPVVCIMSLINKNVTGKFDQIHIWNPLGAIKSKSLLSDGLATGEWEVYWVKGCGRGRSLLSEGLWASNEFIE